MQHAMQHAMQYAMHDTMHGDLAVIITAGGTSSRFGSNKLLAKLGDATVLERSTLAFVGKARQIVVAIAGSIQPGTPLADAAFSIRARAGETTIDFIDAAGSSRAQTVLNALRLIDARRTWVAIHDGARPLVSVELIDRVLAAAKEHGAAAPALPVTLTIKQAGATLPTRVERTLPRANLYAMQTPQVMRRENLMDAYARCPIPLEQVTDDVQLLELVGELVTLVAGDERNLKLTTLMDLQLVQLYDDRQS